VVTAPSRATTLICSSPTSKPSHRTAAIWLDGWILHTQRHGWLVAGAIWGPGLFMVAWMFGGFFLVGYSPVHDRISELAAVRAPTRVLMTLGFAAYGVGVGTSAWPLRRVIGKPAAAALGLNATFTLGVMLTPLDRSPDIDFLHAVFAALAYLSLAVAGPLASLAFRRRSLILAVVSFVVGLVTMVGLGASLGDTAPGLFQRLGLTTTDVWSMAIGLGVVVGRLRRLTVL